MQHLLSFVLSALLAGCGMMGLNQDIQADLSDDPKTCVNGLRYLPYTNATDEAFTSEGKVIACQPKKNPP